MRHRYYLEYFFGEAIRVIDFLEWTQLLYI